MLSCRPNVALLFLERLLRVGSARGTGGGSPGAEREGVGVPKRRGSRGSPSAGGVPGRAGKPPGLAFSTAPGEVKSPFPL